MELRRIRCRVRPGLFAGEYVVSVPTIDSHSKVEREFVADSRGVYPSVAPNPDRPVEGEFAVWYVGPMNGGDRVLVPASAGSESRYVVVPHEILVA